MLLIRREQLTVFDQIALEEFEARLQGHLGEGFELQIERLGPVNTRALVRHAIERARHHGYESERDVYLYLCLMLMLGSGFDEDPQLPWAASELGDDGRRDEGRLLRVHVATMTYLDNVAGANNEHLVKALLRVRRFDPQTFVHLDAVALPQQLARVTRDWYPEKASFQGPLATLKTMVAAVTEAREHGLLTSYGQGVYAGLAFMLGAAFATDPQFPWAAGALSRPLEDNGDVRARSLYAEAIRYLVELGLRGG